MSQSWFRSLCAGAVSLSFLASCGGSSSTPSNPSSSPTPNPAPTPTPQPTPTPTPDPRAGLAPGPIATYRIKLRSRDPGDQDYQDPEEVDEQGRLVVRRGEFIVFDSTQRNQGGQICVWINDPIWTITDVENEGILSRRGSSNPFLLRADVVRQGVFQVSASVDGIGSNTLTLVAVR